ncbi:MAG TPA: hypothetical protein VGL62_05620 [Vicinamibacterales bacterium]|jgi:hypothetical protein
MTKRISPGRILGVLAAVAGLLTPAVASAQIRQVSSSSSGGGAQTINFTIGYFALKGLDSRVSDDVLFNDLQSDQPLLFNVSDFNSVIVGGEYLLRVVPHVEVGAGASFYQRTVPSVYADLTHSDNTEIAQNLTLRTVPVSFTARFLPLGSDAAVQPYVGAGVVAIRWRYVETGEFVDVNNSIFSARYEDNGTAVGPTVLAGVRVPFGAALAGAEVRWQRAQGSGLLSQGFLGDKIDLGGWTTNFTLGWRF